jgi:ABC-2 type transport system permease protein
MSGYWALARGSFFAWMVYRFGGVFTLITNLLYMVVIYFLWRNIYGENAQIHGMSFNQAFIYLSLAGSIFNALKTYIDWMMSRNIITGNVAVDIIKPMDFQFQMYFRAAGTFIYNFFLITLPSAVMLFLVFRADVQWGIGLLFFPLGLVLAFSISFAIDYVVGVAAFYTESNWGISMTKEIIVTLLAGALVPLQFFPEAAQAVLKLLPFQAIYHLPLTMIISPNLPVMEYLQMLGIQAFWVAALFMGGRLFFNRASRALFINGG